MKATSVHSVIDKNAYPIFMAKKTQVEMMKDRGLEVPDHEEEMFLSYDENKERLSLWEARHIPRFVDYYSKIAIKNEVNFDTTLSQVYYPKSDPDRKTVVIYLFRSRETATISTDEFQKKFHEYQTKYSKRGLPLKMIFISEVPVNSKAIGNLTYIQSQFFLTSSLRSNPTRHDYYSPHVLIEEEERKEIFGDGRLTPDALQIIRRIDPICQYFDWKDGDIIKIYREQRHLNVIAPKNLNLRIVKSSTG